VVGACQGLLDRESLVVSTNVPPQVGKTEAQWQQRETDNVGRAQRHQAEADQATQDVAALSNTNAQVNANAQGNQPHNNGVGCPPPAGQATSHRQC
jgi:hypothetical protein